MRRIVLAICGCALGAALLAPASASAVPTCSYVAVAETFSVALDSTATSAKVTIERSGANLQALDANGAVIGPCAGVPATVTNTDLIEVVDPDAGHNATVVVSESGGDFTPGANTPPDAGTPEIDISVNFGGVAGGTGDRLEVEGQDITDNWLFGESAAGDLGANLNATESSPDADLTASAVETALLSGRKGDDDISAVGSAAIPAMANSLSLNALTIEGGNQNDALRGGAGPDSVQGGTQDDNVKGGDGDDSLDGGEQDDKLDGGAKADAIEGGADTDRVLYDDRTTALNVTVGNNGADDGGSEDQSGGNRDNVGATVEHVTGGSAGDSISGSSSRNVLNGGLGNDVLNGLDGNDDLEGEGGNDTMDGGGGNDEIRGSDGTDTGRGGAGGDDLFGGNSADQLLGGNGSDFIKGDKGKDVHSGQAGNDKLNAKDNKKDQKISCGKGKAAKESAKVDKQDPKAQSC